MGIVDELKRGTVLEFLKSGKRVDGRSEDDYRPIVIEKGIITSAEGSAKARLGKSQVLAGVKVDLSIPFKDKPDEGTLTVGADFLPLAHATFEPGPPNELAIELARIVDRGIRSSEAIDLKSLLIEEGKSWGVFIDIYVLDHDGNLIDAAALAAVSALKQLKLPKYVEGKVVRDEYKPMPLKEVPTYCTFAKIGDKVLVDPSYDEETAMDARLTISVGDNDVYAMQKAGPGGFTREEVMSMIDRSFAQRKKLLTLI